MSPPSAVIASAYSRSSARLVGGLFGIEAGLREQVLVVEQRRHVRVQRDAVEAVVERRDRHVAGARGRRAPVQSLDLVGQVDELAGVLELRGVDQVHAHQVRHVAGGDALGDLADHLGVGDVAEVDRLVGVRRVPVADELVDHALVAARPLPHLHRAVVGALGAVASRAPASGPPRRALSDAAGALAAAPGAHCRRRRCAAPLGDVVPRRQAAISRTAMIARAGNLRWFLIPCSSISIGPGVSGERDAAGLQPRAWRHIPRTQSSAYIRLQQDFSLQDAAPRSVTARRNAGGGSMDDVRLGINLWSQASDWPAFLAAGHAGRGARLRPPLDVGPRLRDLRRSGPADLRGLHRPRGARPGHGADPPRACSSGRTRSATRGSPRSP